MERKYYLRGLGLGIAVTAVIMGMALSGNDAMTNEEIIARAKELGLVENTVLSDTGNEDAAQEDLASAEGTEADPGPKDADSEAENVVEETDVDIAGGSGQETDSAEESVWQNDEGETDSAEESVGQNDEDEADSESGDSDREEVQDNSTNFTADDAETGDTAETGDSGGIITSATVQVITIKSGDSSYTVAKKLADVGVVTSAETFDTFLCQNGYDKRLRTGTFSIPADASDEQIARIVTGLE